MRDRYDVIVVGAGPAGSMAAKTAAEHDLETLLLEKRVEIGDPVRCAEGVGKEGLKQFIKPDKRWIAADVQGARICFPGGIKIEMSEVGPEVGYVLERKIFDRELAKQAAKAGAEVMVKTRAVDLIKEDGFVRGVKAEHLGDSFDIHADVVIGADGVESKVGRWAGINTTLKPKDIETCAQFLMTDVDIDPCYCEFYIGNQIAPGGYAWVFPKGNNEANVGLGISGSRSEVRPIEHLKRFVEKKYPEGQIIEMIMGGVPVTVPTKTTTNGLMLVGDAARMSDPLTGGGIIHAMKSGTMASEIASKAVQSGDSSVECLNEYERRWRPTIGATLQKSYKAKEWLLKLNDAEWNSIASSIVGINFKELTAFGLLKELTLRNPKLLWDLRSLL
ncbi:MAG: NAD(P)/FAD-dependent oxidoreductase [Methanocellales archaeon]|nr:NAD(P)/FAD-dependent oxidoreductase [Methanocellales archaeon]MDD3290955.1 NAD(P)/FAD-dependent oxidoreductase [Methanocellales archaeon]MDD5234840.1 NAD(P)/FAD-dependent oxidoreductase [Methanocellales archaeon]MDD5484790.1 NAD(P)/FAD-dependent oxidoreductase [Methanocellales archaeon]